MTDADPARAPTAPSGGGRAVLIIDDEATLGRNIATYLGRLGWETLWVASAEAGLQRLPEFRPDVILLDHNLPGATGLEALPRLLAAEPAAQVVLMTGHGSIDLAVSAMKQGAADYLAKPLALSELRLLLERLLGQHRLARTVDYYRGRVAESSGLDKLLGASAPMQALRERISMLIDAERALVDGDAPTVLIHGETGTGKELVARALHFGGARAQAPFVELNCGALPQHLVEAELFGYERGAFTDARERKTGLVEAAQDGTLFLDEIGEADAGTQVKLLKLLEDRRIRRLGSSRELQVNVRIVAATHRSLEQMVREGRFRADLYFRLRIVELTVPPLRERGDDVMQLAGHFLAHHAQRYRRPAPQLDAQAIALLRQHGWPGNVRELRNAMEQALLLARGAEIGRRELAFLDLDGRPGVAATAVPESLNLEQHERTLIQTALDRSGGNVSQAARLLGISRDTLRYRLERHGMAADAAPTRPGGL
jgi:two-component system response regulator AtoC